MGSGLNASVVKLIFNNDKKITLQNSYIICHAYVSEPSVIYIKPACVFS
jgi:hypothetical protein